MHPRGAHQQKRVHPESGIAEDQIQAQTTRILESPVFLKSKRLSRFLSFAVENALAGREDALKESVLGIEVFDRGPGFDPRLDPIVRIDARRLRARLADYYQGPGTGDPIVIEFETGSYVPRFRAAQPAAPPRPVSAPKPIRKVLTLDLLRRARNELEDVPNVESIFKALDLFQRAAATTPENVQAHLGIALASIWMPVLCCESSHASMARARAAAERALELDNANPAAHTALGMVAAIYDHDFPAANASLLLATRLSPDFHQARAVRATAWLAPMGHLTEAAETVESVLRKDSNPRFHFNLGYLRFLLREWESVIRHMERVLEANPRFIPARSFLVRAYERLGLYDQADAVLRDEELRNAYPLVVERSEVLALLRNGAIEQATAAAQRMAARFTPGSSDPLQLAEVFAALGDADSAFEWLNRAYEDRRSWLIYLNSDAAFDTLREDPRFSALQARLGLAAVAAPREEK